MENIKIISKKNLVYICIISNNIIKKNVDHCQTKINTYYENAKNKNIKYNLIVDLSKIYLSKNYYNNINLSELYINNFDNTIKYVSKIFIIIDNIIIRNLINLFFKFYKFPIKINFVKKLDDIIL
jgi:hypothetical protein